MFLSIVVVAMAMPIAVFSILAVHAGVRTIIELTIIGHHHDTPLSASLPHHHLSIITNITHFALTKTCFTIIITVVVPAPKP